MSEMEFMRQAAGSSESMDADARVLECSGLKKTYRQGAGVDVPVLLGVDFEVGFGERVAIIGASGSGKSTLLHLLGGLDSPSSGTVRLMGRDLSAIGEGERGVLRNRHLGFVYQFHHLLPEFTALENVAMPLYIRRMKKDEADECARAILGEVGLSHRLDHTPSELSGGERQRAALARALVTRPACVLADEPTGNLDPENSAAVSELLYSNAEKWGKSLLVVTHDKNVAGRAMFCYQLIEGVLKQQDRNAPVPFEYAGTQNDAVTRNNTGIQKDAITQSGTQP